MALTAAGQPDDVRGTHGENGVDDDGDGDFNSGGGGGLGGRAAE